MSSAACASPTCSNAIGTAAIIEQAADVSLRRPAVVPRARRRTSIRACERVGSKVVTVSRLTPGAVQVHQMQPGTRAAVTATTAMSAMSPSGTASFVASGGRPATVRSVWRDRMCRGVRPAQRCR